MEKLQDFTAKNNGNVGQIWVKGDNDGEDNAGNSKWDLKKMNSE